MSAEKLKSFIFQLGFDGKEAIDGLKAAEGLLKKIKKLGVTKTKPIEYDFGEFDSHVKMFERVQKAEEKAAKKRAKEIDANHSSHVQLYREIEVAEKNRAKREKDLAKDKSQNHSQHVIEYNQLKNLEDEKIKREKELAKDKSQNHSEHVDQYKQYITDVRDAEKEAYKEKNQRERDAAKLKEDIRKSEIAAYKEQERRDKKAEDLREQVRKAEIAAHKENDKRNEAAKKLKDAEAEADKKALEEKARANLVLHDTHVKDHEIWKKQEAERRQAIKEENALRDRRGDIMMEIARIEALGGQLRESDAVIRGKAKVDKGMLTPDYTSILKMDLADAIMSNDILELDTTISKLKEYKKELTAINGSALALDQRSRSAQALVDRNKTKTDSIISSIDRLGKLGYDTNKLLLQEEDLKNMDMGLSETTKKLNDYHSTLKSITRQQIRLNDAAKKASDDEARNLDKITLKKKAQNLLDDINRKYKGVDGVIRGPNDAMTQAIEIQIKTIKAFQSRLDKVGTSKGLINMRKVFSQINGDIINMNRNIKSFNQDLSFTQRLAKSVNKSMHNFAASWVSAFAIAAGATSVIGLGQDLEAARVGMNIVSGSAEELGANFEYVKNKSLDFGTNLTETTRSFTKIKAAAELANLSMDDTRNMFESVMEGSVAFGLTQEQTNGVFKAYSDMLSKGTVSLEELKG